MPDELREAYREEQRVERDVAFADLTHAITEIEKRGVADSWERAHLVRAFTAFFSGCYGIARGDAELALAPSHERSPTVRLPEGGFLERYDIPLLKLILAEAKAEALVEFPRFGRVEVR